MTVVNPDNTSHIISLVPRFDTESIAEAVKPFEDRVIANSGTVESEACVYDVMQNDFISIVITDSFKGTSSSVGNTFYTQDGKIVITFDYDFRNESRCDLVITLTNTLEVLYRGILIATTQDTQDYKLTKDKFYY